jgi:hypothetical protein
MLWSLVASLIRASAGYAGSAAKSQASLMPRSGSESAGGSTSYPDQARIDEEIRKLLPVEAPFYNRDLSS